MIKNFLYKKAYPSWKSKYSTRLKRSRVRFINNMNLDHPFDSRWLNGKRVLEVGCGEGKDFIQFFDDSMVQITAIDIKDQILEQSNVTFMKIDAQELPFEDKQFDLTVSFGVLEHIQPIEKLCKVISEIDRVSKSYAIIVPNISTLIEPHAVDLFWQLRSPERKCRYSQLNYYSDEAWLQFKGFSKARIKRYSYIPFLIKNTLIYKGL